MSRLKRTPEEEIHHLRKKLRKLESQNPPIMISGEYEDRDSRAFRRKNSPQRGSDDDAFFAAAETSACITSPGGPKEPRAKSEQRHNSMEVNSSRSDPRLNLKTLDASSSRCVPRVYPNTLDESSSSNEPQANFNNKEVNSSRKELQANLNAMEANSSNINAENNPQTNLNDIGENHSRSDPQNNLNNEEAHSSTNTPDKPSPETNRVKRNTGRPRTSLNTSEASNSRKKRTSSETSQAADSDNLSVSDRNEALLKALGDDLSLSGEFIHPSLAQKWLTILRKGLTDDIKEKLLKEYVVPENCKDLKAPTLNDEVSAVVEYQAKNRDRIMEGKQNQMGLGITAIGRGITVLLNQGNNYEVNAMRHFNHGCRILLDLHYIETNSRRHLFKKDLFRSEVFRNLRIQELERDDTLFGNKVAKMVKKQGIPTIPIHHRSFSNSYAENASSFHNRARIDANLAKDDELRYRRT